MGELGEFAKHAGEFRALDVQILAISVDPIAKARWVHDHLHTPFPILSDAKQQVMKLYGTRSPEYRNLLGISVNTPTLVLIDQQGIIRWIHQASNFRLREPVEKVLAQARKLSHRPKPRNNPPSL
ncbi:MAG: redoxin domain-containing protein [Acidobacteria bacterium]|nr:MAG: redoxin domain-containing protein [Acidobacteriota bacterium]